MNAIDESFEELCERLREQCNAQSVAARCGGLAVVDIRPGELSELLNELDRLRGLINTPETADFIRGVPLEAAHQRERWGEQHDEKKSGEEWVFLFGFLSGKAVQALKAGDVDKAQHHAITAAAALANFHRLAAGQRPAAPRKDAR
jgi:hypothetical protein